MGAYGNMEWIYYIIKIELPTISIVTAFKNIDQDTFCAFYNIWYL